MAHPADSSTNLAPQVFGNQELLHIEERVVVRGGIQERFLTIPRCLPDDFEAAFRQISQELQESNMSIGGMEIFGTGAYEYGARAAEEVLGEPASAIMWVEDEVRHAAAIQVWALSGLDVKPLMIDGEMVGTIFEDDYWRYVRLGDIKPRNTTASRPDQAKEVFDRLEQAVELAGMKFIDTKRTWFYNDDILGWYDEFNAVRTAFFKERNVFDIMVPASTGIGAKNPDGAALVAALFAAVPKNGDAKAAIVPSPLQCPAPEYGSSFSRALQLSDPNHRRLFVSGTASIEPEGATAHVGDLMKQIDLTVRVVEGILEHQGMDWRDAVRATAYFSSLDDCPAWAEYCRQRGMPAFPVAVFNGVVCRPDLLFELEVDAMVTPNGIGG